MVKKKKKGKKTSTWMRTILINDRWSWPMDLHVRLPTNQELNPVSELNKLLACLLNWACLTSKWVWEKLHKEWNLKKKIKKKGQTNSHKVACILYYQAISEAINKYSPSMLTYTTAACVGQTSHWRNTSHCRQCWSRPAGGDKYEPSYMCLFLLFLYYYFC